MSYIPKEAVEGNALFEGYHKRLSDDRAAPYLCPARVATIGFGTTQLPGGKKVNLSMAPITREIAKAYMANDLQIAARGVDRYVKVSLHDLQASALIMFANNCGVGALQHSTLLWCVNRKDWEKAGREFMKWVNGGGRRLTGLVRRRAYEREMFLRGAKALSVKNKPLPPPLPERRPSLSAQTKLGFWKRIWNVFE